jgi:putative ABC transport system permease protein
MLALTSILPAHLTAVSEIGIDGTVLGFTLIVSIVTSVLFGLVPGLHASRIDLIEAVKAGGGRTVAGGRTTRTRAVLVVAEIALTVVLLTGAGLLLKSLVALQNVELGFRPENVLVMKATGVRTLAENTAFFSRLLPRLAAVPAVTAVGATSIPPGDLALSGDGAYHIDRVPEVRDRNNEPHAMFTIVTPGAFAALGIPITRGRDFSETDTKDRPFVAIVNEALVRKSMPGEDPIGRMIFCSWDSKEGMTIVGVVGDSRQRAPGLEPMPDCYMPYTQHAYNGNSLNVVARTDGDPMALAPALRRAAAEVAAEVPVAFTTMDATIAKRLEEPKFRALLFVVLALVAGCLAMAGVYGVVAHAAEERSREIGVRMALGAERNAVLRMMLGRAVKLAAIGAVLGLSVAAAAARILETMLFEVKPLDARS